MYFADGDFIAGAHVSAFNDVRLHKRGRSFVITRNHAELLGRHDKLDKAVEQFERATTGMF